MNQCDECEQGKAANNTVAPPRSLCHESGTGASCCIHTPIGTSRTAAGSGADGLIGRAALAARTARAVRRVVMRIDLLYSCSFRSNIRAISSMGYDLMSR